MAYRICPACGSRYFLIHRDGADRQVFVVGEDGELLQVSDNIEGKRLDATPPDISCGACSWHGAFGDLRFSDL